LLDESPHEDREAFLVSPIDQIPDRQNIAIGILGLTAPKDSDFMEYGSEIASLYKSASFSQVQEKMYGSGTIQPTVDPSRVFCWLYQRRENNDCLPQEQVPKILLDNTELLHRFRSLHRLNQYSNLYQYHNVHLIDILRLSIVDIHLHLQRGEFEVAFTKWRDQLLFSKNLLAGTDGLIGKTVARLTFVFTLPHLENILAADPELANKYKEELAYLLEIDGVEAFNLDGIQRAEYSILKQALEYPPEGKEDKLSWLVFHLGQKQRILNRYYEFSKDYTKALRLPWSQIEEEVTRLREKHLYPSPWDILIDPFGTVLLSEYFLEARIESLTGELINLHAIDGKLRLASLLVLITNADIEDDEIPAFIEAAGPAYYNPLLKAPMKWNPDKRIIIFPYLNNPCEVKESFRIPDNRTRGLLSTPRPYPRLC
ncbi:MAG: hypothetical protein OEY09_15910, partial [Gammaproteobacteria bacterium]|nr:hypothetical protein [Gammaproteobacteria bacterium]